MEIKGKRSVRISFCRQIVCAGWKDVEINCFCSSLKNKFTVRNLPPIMWCRRVFRRMHTTEIRVRNQYKSPLNGCSPFNSPPPPKHLPRRIIMSTEEYSHTVRCKVGLYQTIVPILSKLLHFPLNFRYFD